MNRYIIQPPQQLISGSIVIEYKDERIFGLEIQSRRLPSQPPGNGYEERLSRQFVDYFDDPSRPFSLQLAPEGTDFQRRVWEALRTIKSGDIARYGELAWQLSSSPRAIGNACRRNPIAILIPCHRVVAATGIGGFAGTRSGPHIDQKLRLLQHEGVSL
ncbi:MAG: methylated-DNA--[protein]-cysteine S-methyltransferase [Gammaproteobacteria bacterium]|nr:methylated-DNA--[protein]-cysteine S-methyltransferase [Gammaproteobacteria bacterium]